MRPGDRYFACTRCGACCDRSPEVELSEAAALADMFVFRLMLRLYPNGGNDRLRHFAAARLPGHAGAVLTLSALTVDAGTGACGALADRLCTIHERRPLSCRSVPLHYSIGDRSMEQAFDSFVETARHECDTGAAAPLLLTGDKLVDPMISDARSAAVTTAKADREWKDAIVSRMRLGGTEGLPAIDDVRQSASTGALTTSMRIAWAIAVEEEIMAADDLTLLMARQLETIDRMLARPMASESRQTLGEMRVEYALALGSARVA